VWCVSKKEKLFSCGVLLVEEMAQMRCGKRTNLVVEVEDGEISVDGVV
jgi:hypothetical protein